MLYCLLDAQMPVTRGQKRRRDAAVQGSIADSHPAKRAAILNKSSSTTVPVLIPTVIWIIAAPPEPDNRNEIKAVLGQPRRSLSPSHFSEGDHDVFRWKNNDALGEKEVMNSVFPIIAGDC